MQLIVPKFVSLDTSQLGRWIDDHFSNVDIIRLRAREFYSWVDSHFITITLSLNRIQELICHDSEYVARRRLEFIRNLGMLAWVKGKNGGFGSFIDVLYFEIMNAATSENVSISEVRNLTRRDLFQVGSGEQLLGSSCEPWIRIRPLMLASAQRAREIVTLARSNAIDIKDVKLDDIVTGKRILKGKELDQRLLTIRNSIYHNIQQTGDDRVEEKFELVNSFMSSVVDLASPLPETPEDMLKSIINKYGINMEEASKNTTLGDLGRMYQMQKLLDIAAGSGGDGLETGAICKNSLPTYQFFDAINSLNFKHNVNRGSDISDEYLASTAIYSDITFVDKRMAEKIRQIKIAKPEIAEILNLILPVCSYDKIPSVLSSKLHGESVSGVS